MVGRTVAFAVRIAVVVLVLVRAALDREFLALAPASDNRVLAPVVLALVPVGNFRDVSLVLACASLAPVAYQVRGGLLQVASPVPAGAYQVQVACLARVELLRGASLAPAFLVESQQDVAGLA
jgi:hypothetical protein